LVGTDAWSIFIAGPKASTWHFWDRRTKRRAHWRTFVEAKRGQLPEAAWEPDAREVA
jgi:hypothetical protein